ncbi:KAP family NTPase [Enterobacter bugandensis]|uniref:P-loop NTPase fold protein n=1 Tax=Enterobacter bugandensis TaxID=881260 RepID=UPI001BCD5531|nr:P-loop NTPase fold protein [Enterobacter bugandensis]EHN8827650.1 hypothetical protein [Enterobacter bugandensis]EHN8845398.1 hypothetical protein [Enterobacter bugandensis]MCK6702168.1 KAP family NTPase [Enterobacter bugandensis]MCK6777636.1 KAP family NTPase [Enterobacter bugandensis]
MNNDNNSTNEHLKSYISYYNNLKNPKYAVLVKGEWGVGKTHLINSILKNDEKFYISLFGLTTVQEVHAAVFMKMYPNRSKVRNLFNLLGNSSAKTYDVTLSFGPLIGNIANALIKEKVDNSKPIIFDDLERCSIKTEDLFGAINKYVEHHECKVIVIAHDEKLGDGLTDKKEKIFGQIIKVTPNINDAFEHFIKTSKMPSAFEPIKDIVYKSFLASECKSLRVLDYVIKDCTRLLTCIAERLDKNSPVLTELFVLFTALDINYRLGKLGEKELNLRNSVVYYVNKDKKTGDIFDEINENYKKHDVFLHISSDILSNEILINTIINGIYDKEKIIECINNSRHFIESKAKGPWYTIMNFDSIDTVQIDKAINILYSKFDNLEITERGEILHSVNLLFMLSDIKHINKSLDDVYSFFLDYVKKLQSNNKFHPAELFPEYDPIRDSSYGYGFWIKDSYKHYSSKLYKILEHHEQIALKKKYPLFLAELKRNLKEDTSKFCEQISRYGIKQTNTYGYISILAGFKPHEFVDMWLSIEMKDWHNVRTALVSRYKGGSLRNELEEEGPWLKSIKMNIRHRASKASGIDRLRLSRLLIELS